MAETSLNSLAQNVEAGEWPLPGADETPSKYVVYSWEELHELPAFAAQPVLVELLVRILNDTLSFDEPFQEMVDASQKVIATEFSAIKTLTKLHIPEDFPITLTSLSQEAKDLCASQGFRTLGEYVRLSQKISQLIIMEGDFRAFLNALSFVDESTIARYLPFRPGHKGLHLAEAIGAILRQIPAPETYALAKTMGFKALSAEQNEQAAAVSKQRLADIQQGFRIQFHDVAAWFQSEVKDWRTNQQGNQSLPYRLRVLNDPVREAVALGLVTAFFAPAAATSATPGGLQEATPALRVSKTSGSPATAVAAAPSSTAAVAAPPRAAAAPEKKPGLFDRLFGLFRK